MPWCYLLHLVKDEKLSHSTMNQAACAAQFLFQTVLGHQREHFQVPFAKVPVRRPELLAREEIARLFAACSHRMRRMLLCRCARVAGWGGCTLSRSCLAKPDCPPRRREDRLETQARYSWNCSAFAGVGGDAARQVQTKRLGPTNVCKRHRRQARFSPREHAIHAQSGSCALIIDPRSPAPLSIPLLPAPRRGSVQQGLSAAGGAPGFYPLGLAADKRYSIGLIDDKHWSAVMTYRGPSIRLISVRRSRTEEVALYESQDVRKTV